MLVDKKKKPRCKIAPSSKHHSHHVGEYLLYYRVLHIHLFKDCVNAKNILDNYDDLIDSKEHI
jgi:hypothetical protein